MTHQSAHKHSKDGTPFHLRPPPAFTLSQEARNTANHASPWLNQCLRDRPMQFVSSSVLTREELNGEQKSSETHSQPQSAEDSVALQKEFKSTSAIEEPTSEYFYIDQTPTAVLKSPPVTSSSPSAAAIVDEVRRMGIGESSPVSGVTSGEDVKNSGRNPRTTSISSLESEEEVVLFAGRNKKALIIDEFSLTGTPSITKKDTEEKSQPTPAVILQVQSLRPRPFTKRAHTAIFQTKTYHNLQYPITCLCL